MVDGLLWQAPQRVPIEVDNRWIGDDELLTQGR